MPAERDAQSTGQYPFLVGSSARPWLRRWSGVPWRTTQGTNHTVPASPGC